MHRSTKGLHHYYLRKRLYKNYEPYPHPNKWKNFVDKAIYVIGILGPIIVMPQLLKIWIFQDATGVSLLTWGLWMFIDSFWLIYGVMHRVLPIILSHTAYMITQMGVVIGILLYG